MKQFRVAACAAALALVAGLTAAEEKKPAEDKDIVETAVASGKFKTLVAAVTEAGLVETLKGDGPFTVFAPTDEAFAKLDKETLDAVLKDKKKLTAILTYHVVKGNVMAKDVATLKTAKTVQGGDIMIDAGRGVMLNGKVKVVATDIKCKNGVIHVIDTVLMPPDGK